MKSIHLALAIHNHQPVGNFDFIIADAYKAAYLPMIELLERHRSVRLALHYTGPLRDWIAANQPNLLRRIRALVARGQVEIMTGGYYEPILAAIPDADKLGQIDKLTRAVRKDFGYIASGLWLAERVWEPSLAKPIAEAGVAYTVVDDTHFKYVGLEDKDLFGYYITEEQGATLKIFGTSKHLRYIIPWAAVDETIEWLREQATEDGSRVAVMGDDGEKFGLWPGTFEHCWGQEAWMEKLLVALDENREWLHTITLADYTHKFPAIGRIYLPTASYDEMSEWAMPAHLSYDLAHLKHDLEDEKREDILRFIRGSFWRNFMVKYPEVNAMHKKMLLVSEKIQGIGIMNRRNGNSLTPGARYLTSALDDLYAGQCNCPYWHGVFGGIYLPHIRTANYAHLIQAETIADSKIHGRRDWVDSELHDYDKDSHKELLVSGSAMNLYFDLAHGGTITEWDWRAKKFNLVNTLSRREEGYHRDLIKAAQEDAVEYPGHESSKLESIHSSTVHAKEPGLDKLLTYDWYRRTGLIDHFIPPDATMEDFAASRVHELGDFVDQHYKHSAINIKPKSKHDKPGMYITLARDGHIWQSDEFVPVRVEKVIEIQAGDHHLGFTYSITNISKQPISARFGVEFCFAMLAGHSEDAFYRAQEINDSEKSLDSRGKNETKEIALVNEFLGIAIQLSLGSKTDLWRFPIETISQSEAGFERVYQASCLLPLWELSLDAGAKWKTRLEFHLKEL